MLLQENSLLYGKIYQNLGLPKYGSHISYDGLRKIWYYATFQ